jgi:hypothetical protein
MFTCSVLLSHAYYIMGLEWERGREGMGEEENILE